MSKAIITTLIVAALLVSTMAPAFAEEESTERTTAEKTQEIGKGIGLGGVATGSPVLAVAGAIIDIVGGWIGTRNIDKESPDFKKRMAMSWGRCLKREVFWQNKAQLNPGVKTTTEEIKAHSESYCATLDKIAAEGGVVELSRERLTEIYRMPEEFLPEGDDDRIFYKITKNPVDNCVQELTEAGHRLVERKKKGLD